MSPMNTRHGTKNPNPDHKPMLAFYFIRALARINKNTSTSSAYQRSCTIKRAAYASMARAAGPRRAWSRAVLCSLRRGSSRPLRHPASRRPRTFSYKRVGVAGPKPRDQPGQVDVLRRLVPGGKAMDLSGLLEETANYIRSLSAQVCLMQNVADSISI